MGNVKHIAVVLALSVGILVAIAWWAESNNQAPDTTLSRLESLEAPLTPEELKVNDPGITNTMNRIAVLNTNKGTIKLELYEDKMPITTGNFIKLAQEGFYDGTNFHRIIDGFMIQGGDSKDGAGGPGYTIQDEFVADPLLSNVRGTIAMANTGQPNSGGSQFFINTVDNTGLDFDKVPHTSKHPVFGRVIDGMDVVNAISAVETGAQDRPIDPVIVNSVVIEAGE